MARQKGGMARTLTAPGAMAKDTGVKSTGRTMSNENTAKQEKKLEELKAKAAADEKKAREKRENAKTGAAKKPQADAGIDGDALKGVVAAAGTALLGSIGNKKTGKSKKKAKKKLVSALVLIALVAVAALLFGPKLKSVLGISAGSIIPGSLDAMKADEVMGYTKVDFQNAILGEAAGKKELIVMELPVQVDSEVSQALANIELFKKTKRIHSFGTGVYTVDMSGISAQSITVDDDERTVSVKIPHAVLQYINKDIEKTEFEDTERALLGLGDFKLTPEQQNLVDISIEASMREVLDKQEQYAKADEFALLEVREIFQPLISAVSEEYLVKVMMD